MAQLNWIVPARRAVVAASSSGQPTLSWQSVHNEWLQTIHDNKARLIEWYAPLDDQTRSAEELTAALDLVLGARPPDGESTESSEEEDSAPMHAARWRPGGPNLPTPDLSRDDAVPAAGASPVPAEIGLHVRLWKGPLRVLRELEETPSFSTRATVERRQATRLTLGDETLRLDLNEQGEVQNQDASFVPGDVLEFPIFKLWWLAGVRMFEGASFTPRGSFLLGTSARDREENAPGALALHDNMLAMRFQLLLNVARGAWPSLDAPFTDTYRLELTNRAALLGRTVFARGMLYAGSFANPRPPSRRSSEPQDRYWFRCNQWGVGSNVPVLSAARSMSGANARRVTWGWACSPSALTLAYYCLAEPGWAGGGSVNAHAREFDAAAAVPRASQVDYFHNQMFSRGAGAAVVGRLLSRENAPASAGLPYLRRAALNQLFLRPRTHGQSTAPTDVEPSDERTTGTSRRLDGDDRDEIFSMAADRGAEGVEDGDVVAPETEYGAGQADAPVEAPRASDLPEGGADVSRSVEEMRRYVSRCISTVGLNGHEYSWVFVRPHADLLALDANRDELASRSSSDERASGPPVAGFIAAYDPLSGVSYSVDPLGDIYIYEATGTFAPSNLSVEDTRIVTFTARPHRFERVEQFWFRQAANGAIYVGDRRGGDGVAGTNTRRKHLVSITRFDADELAAIHAVPRAYLPISFHSRAQGQAPVGASLDVQMFEEWYAFRAVPVPTAREADDHDFYPSIAATTSNLARLRQPGTAPHRTLRDAVESGRGDLSAWGRELVETVFATVFARQVSHATARLTGYYRDAPRSRERRIAELRAAIRRIRGSERAADDVVVRARARTVEDEGGRLDAEIARLSGELAQLRQRRQAAILARDAARARGDSAEARRQQAIASEAWSQIQWQRSPGTRSEPTLTQRLSASQTARERLVRQNPELELVPLLDDAAAGRLRPPPTRRELVQAAEAEVFRTYALKWQQILRDLGAEEVRGDTPPAR
jgi:hypothetical protein